MAADAELLIDRRRLRRKLSLWRVLGIGGLIVAVGAVGYRVRAGTEGGFARAAADRPHLRLGLHRRQRGHRQADEAGRRRRLP